MELMNMESVSQEEIVSSILMWSLFGTLVYSVKSNIKYSISREVSANGQTIPEIPCN